MKLNEIHNLKQLQSLISFAQLKHAHLYAATVTIKVMTGRKFDLEDIM